MTPRPKPARPVGRPPVPPDELLSSLAKVRLTEAEGEELRRLAAKHGLSVSEYVRRELRLLETVQRRAKR